MQEGVNSFAEVQHKLHGEQPDQKPDQLEERTYQELGKLLGLDPKALKEQLPHFADTLEPCFKLANCLRAEGKASEAKTLAQRAADGARKILGPQSPDTKRDMSNC